MNKKMLVIAAHPDDEVLGCGATIARLVKEGADAYVLVLGECTTSGSGDRGPGRKEEAVSKVKEEIKQASSILGVSELFQCDIPDNRFDTVPMLDLVKTVEQYVDRVKPDIIFTHFPGDVNIDHKITYSAVVTAARPVPGCGVKEIYLFEVLSSTGWMAAGADCFAPNYFVDVSSTIDKKVAALESYGSEIMEFPHPRSGKAVRALSEYRGSMTGKNNCEAFMVERLSV